MTTNEESLVARLLSIKSEKEIVEFLKEIDVADPSEDPRNKKYIWKPVGDSFSNAANIHTTNVTIAPIIERITNGIDASLELKEYLSNNGKPLPLEMLPFSPRKAAEKWYGISGGDTAIYSRTLSNKAKNDLAKEVTAVQLHDSEDPRNPTIVIRDNGIGQAPDDFETTFLSLGKSNKLSKPHLLGTYGHGGSSTFRFSNYSIIISRRHPNTTRNEDSIGWTVVRQTNAFQIWDHKAGKATYITQPPVYLYLCLRDGAIPREKPEKSSNAIRHGTYIAHIKYRAKEWENLSRGLGFRLFRNYLFDPILPFRLEDMRKGNPEFNRNMFGDRAILQDAPYVVYKNNDEEQWDETGGKLTIRYWLLHDTEDPAKRPLTGHLERENSANTIIVTLNGQRHGTLEKSLITKKARLPRVSESLLVQIVLDDLPREVKGRLFTSGRMELVREGDDIEHIENRLIQCLGEEDRELRNWENKLNEIRAEDEESIKEVKGILDNLLTIGINLGAGKIEEEQGITEAGRTTKYIPQDPPTTFEMKTKEDPIELRKGESRTLRISLNGSDDLFSRRKNKGKLTVSGSEGSGIDVVVGISKFKNGVLPVTFYANEQAEEFVTKSIKFRFECDNLPESKNIERYFTVIPPPQYVPLEPPTKLFFLQRDDLKLKKGQNNPISIGFDGANDILTRSENCGDFTVTFSCKGVTLIRRIGPYNGKITVTLMVDKDAKVNSEFDLTLSLKLADGVKLTDTRKCIITAVKEKEEEEIKGQKQEGVKPNYSLERITRDRWAELGWNEEKVGQFQVTRDVETGTDRLLLRVNVDSTYLEDERKRMQRFSRSEKYVQRVENKYVAYIAYHLFQQYYQKKEKYTPEVQGSSEPATEATGIMTEEQKDEEMQRVAKTLILSFRSLQQVED
ncbi:MAG: ATP-binding protein [Candidatus Micrarchaeota archaeon]